MTLTAPNFHGPLLRVLGSLTGFQADVVVKATDTYQPILDMMGIVSLDAHGINDASGMPQTVKWIQWANKEARKSGLTSAPPKTRGKWTLTDAGVVEARRLADEAGDAIPASVATPASNFVSIMAQAPAQAPAQALIQAPVQAQVQAQVGYHPDAYIRKLAMDASKCVSRFSNHKSSVCATCPLATECRNQQITTFSRLAIQLADDDRQASPTVATPEASVESKANPAKVRNKFSGIDFSDVDAILNKFADARCEACGEPIAQDERCRWVETIPGTDDGGLFHIACSGGE